MQAGSELGTIHKADSLFVTSNFTVTPRDYGRIRNGAEVELRLPDDRTVTGRVKSVSVETNADGQAKTTVDVESRELSASPSSGITSPGTPVDATLHLQDDGELAGVTDMVRDFSRQIGL